MQFTSESVEALVEQFTKLPTIGRKTARRLTAFVLKMSREDVVAMAEALVAVKDRVRQCSICCTVTEQDPCEMCRSARRDRSVICVVEESNDVMAIERTGEYRGLYHVLGGVISPLDGVGPDDLHIQELVARLRSEDGPVPAEQAPNGQAGEGSAPSEVDGIWEEHRAVPVEEVILAVNPNVEGDTTAYYISQLVTPLGIRVTRIARGLPIGGALEYADEATLSRALEGRGSL